MPVVTHPVQHLDDADPDDPDDDEDDAEDDDEDDDAGIAGGAAASSGQATMREGGAMSGLDHVHGAP